MVPDWNYTPSYMRPQLFSGPARAAHPVQPGPGLMSQDSSPAHGTAPTLFDPTSPHAASSGQRSQPSWRSRSASPGPPGATDAAVAIARADPMSVMEQSRKVAEDALYQNEAGRKKAERERQKAAEEQAGAWDDGGHSRCTSRLLNGVVQLEYQTGQGSARPLPRWAHENLGRVFR
eukprot:s12506_g1.t1